MRYIGWRTTCFLIAVAVAPACAFAAAPDGTQPAQTAQISREGGVTVKVVPRGLRAGATSWEFEVTFETHTQSLNQDMTRAARLIDSQGQPHAPLAWDGDPPGGHHRRGLLRFRPLADHPAMLELQVLGVGDIGTRVFRWRLE